MQALTSTFPTIARVFLGLVFTVFGLNGFLGFLPPPEPTAAGGAFLGALFASGYMFPLIKGTEIAAGLLLLSGRFVPLALTLLAPITINILAYHLFLDPGLGLPLTLIAVQLYLAYAYRESFRPLLTAQPTLAQARESQAKKLGALSTQGA
jgi:uncharacterized membrane protein YphA (DoxX/SURF4 family)